MGDDTKESSDLGGQHPIDYLQKYPNIEILYEGIGYSKEYYQARGHYYALDDVINVSRPKSGASCMACKSAEYEGLYAEYGEDLFAKDFQEMVQDVEQGITCYTCHRNTPGEGVQPTTLHFNGTKEKLDEEIKPGTQACAQCHVEYYMDEESKEVILPWDNGLGINDIEAYYDEREYADWQHPRTGTPLIKVQHPEFEMYSGSLHDSLHVSCADCHMPTMTEEEQEYKSHWVTSPLKTPIESCGSCHGEEAEGLLQQFKIYKKK